MTEGKKKSLSKLQKAVKSRGENSESADFNSFKRILTLYLNTPDSGEFGRKYKKFVAKEQWIGKLYDDNRELFLKELERAFYELAAGTVQTEKVVKKTPKGVFTETRTKHNPPNFNALKFLLTNLMPDKYKENPDGSGENENGSMAGLLEAFKNVK